MSRRVSLSRLFNERIEANSPKSSRSTIEQYKTGKQDFLDYCKDHGFTSNKKIEANGIGTVLRGYLSDMIVNNKTPSTINKYFNIACKCLNLTAKQATDRFGIEKPTVGARRLVKGSGSSERHKQDVESGKYDRLISVAEKVGIRRHEYKQLEGSDLVEVNGRYYVHVLKGKGGKETFQKVLPQDVEFMKKTFAEIGSDEKLFTKKELTNKLDLHGAYRVGHAKDVYQYAFDMIKNGKSDLLVREIKEQFYRFYFSKDKKDFRDFDKVGAWEKYKKTITNEKPYHARSKAIQDGLEKNGLGNDLNRLAVAYTSVFALSHWRLNVTVSNYLCR